MAETNPLRAQIIDRVIQKQRVLVDLRARSFVKERHGIYPLCEMDPCPELPLMSPILGYAGVIQPVCSNYKQSYKDPQSVGKMKEEDVEMLILEAIE